MSILAFAGGTILILSFTLSAIANIKKEFRCSELFNLRNCIYNGQCLNGTSPTVRNCVFSNDCRSNITKVYANCKELHEGVRGECTEKCKAVLRNFWSSKTGVIMTRCSCQNDVSCTVLRSRYHSCLSGKVVSKKNSCVEAQRLCMENKICSKLFSNYFDVCKDLLFGAYECTKKCMKAEQKLFGYRIGKRLKTCTCDGTVEEEKFCRGVRLARRKLCSLTSYS